MRSHVFSLCPDSHFAHEQFRNCTSQNKNSYLARQSENSHFAKWEFSLCAGQFRNCTDSHFAQNIYTLHDS